MFRQNCDSVREFGRADLIDHELETTEERPGYLGEEILARPKTRTKLGRKTGYRTVTGRFRRPKFLGKSAF